jgi:membrane protein
LGRRFQAYGILGGVLVLTIWVWLVGLLLYLGMVVGVTCSTGRRSARPERLGIAGVPTD